MKDELDSQPEKSAEYQNFDLLLRLILFVLIPLVILVGMTFAYVQWVRVKSHAVANFDPGWRPATGKDGVNYYNPTNQN